MLDFRKFADKFKKIQVWNDPLKSLFHDSGATCIHCSDFIAMFHFLPESEGAACRQAHELMAFGAVFCGMLVEPSALQAGGRRNPAASEDVDCCSPEVPDAVAPADYETIGRFPFYVCLIQAIFREFSVGCGEECRAIQLPDIICGVKGDGRIVGVAGIES